MGPCPSRCNAGLLCYRSTCVMQFCWSDHSDTVGEVELLTVKLDYGCNGNVARPCCTLCIEHVFVDAVDSVMIRFMYHP